MNNNDKIKKFKSAHTGLHHWIWQRMSAGFLLIMSVFFAYVILFHGIRNLIEITYQSLFLISMICLFINVALYHGMLGMQMIIEDYMPNLCTRNTIIILLKFLVFQTIFLNLFTSIYYVANYL